MKAPPQGVIRRLEVGLFIALCPNASDCAVHKGQELYYIGGFMCVRALCA